MLKNIKQGAVLALIGVMLISTWTVFTPLTANAAVTTVNINGAGAGRTFEGEGVLSGGGGNSKLLYDYPEPYRSEILDYLFKPNFGASYHELKVEIGADVNSTSGTEPSHARTLAENSNPNMTRGYETWMLSQAKQRNPSIMTYGLEWGAPGWIGSFYSQNNADYLVSYIKGLKNVWGIDLDYIGGNQNESFNGTSVQARDYIVNILRPTLNNNGLSAVKIIAPDILSSDWAFANQIISDSALKSAVAAIGYHYVNNASTSNAQNSGLPIWESEGWTGIGDWNGAFALAKEMNLNYINGKMTKTDVWHAIESAYDNTNWAHSGIMEANTPWSGYYIVQPAVWAAAHTNQFAQPGWKYLDSGSGVTAGGTSYVTLKNPANGNYSIVIVTGTSAESITFNLSGGLATTAVHVWKSNSTAQFIQQSDITVSGSSYTLNVDPNSIYSLTTTTGQQKGVAAHAIPANTPLALPYSDNFEGYAVGATPRYTQDTEGAFEVASRYGGGGNALRQVITGSLLQWNSWGDYPHPSAFTELGSLSWQNYDFSSDVLIENSGGVSIYGRVGVAKPGGNVNDYKGYRLSIYQTGSWYLCYGDAWTYETANDQCLASGTVSGFTANTWHNLKLSFSGNTIKAYIDSNQVANVTSTLRSAGMVGLGSGWNNAQFDNLNVTSGSGPTNLALGKVASADSAEAANPAANGNDGSASTRWCAADGNTGHWWKVDLGASYSLTGSEVMWEFDGRVYKYKVEVSPDNVNWTQVVNKTANTLATQTQNDPFTATARYVRITVTGLPTSPVTWASFFEFRVFGGAGGPTPTPTNTPVGPTATPTRTPTPGITSVNDNTLGTGQNQFNYTGTWSYGSQTGAYQNDNHWTGTANTTYQVAFTGTKVQIYAAKANNHGIFAVSIDGGAETNVDLYAATRADQVLVWTSPILTSGSHTVKVRVTGTKNASSTGTAIVADRVDITP